jgi:hypothetical protein
MDIAEDVTIASLVVAIFAIVGSIVLSVMSTRNIARATRMMHETTEELIRWRLRTEGESAQVRGTIERYNRDLQR